MTHRRLLVVDDEEALLALMERFLRRSGFSVTGASSGELAWKALLDSDGGFSLIILDLTLPGLSGVDLLMQLRGVSLTIPVLLLSGYPFDTASLPVCLQSNVWFVQKPFSPKTLVVLIEEILGEL